MVFHLEVVRELGTQDKGKYELYDIQEYEYHYRNKRQLYYAMKIYESVYGPDFEHEPYEHYEQGHDTHKDFHTVSPTTV